MEIKKIEILQTLCREYLFSSHDSCVKYGSQAIMLAQELNDIENEALANKRIGYALSRTGDYNTSLLYFESLKISQNICNRDYKKAFQYYSQFVVLKDSVLGVETRKKIADIQTKYETEKKEKENGAKDNSEELIEKLSKYMNNEKPYLFRDVSLDDISRKLNTNRSYLSKLINAHFNQNFNEFINEYRIKNVRQLLADHKNKHLSIEGINSRDDFKSPP